MARRLGMVAAPDHHQQRNTLDDYISQLRVREADTSRDLEEARRRRRAGDAELQGPADHSLQEDRLAHIVADAAAARLSVPLMRMQGQLEEMCRQMQHGFDGIHQEKLRAHSSSAKSDTCGNTAAATSTRSDTCGNTARKGSIEGLHEAMARIDGKHHPTSPSHNIHAKLGLLDDVGHDEGELLHEESTQSAGEPGWASWFHGCHQTKEPERDSDLAECVDSDAFGKVSMVVIFINTLFTWHSTDWTAAHLGETLPTWMRAADFVFLCYYLTEVVLKLIVHHMFFFWNKDWGWNLFDFVIVFLGVFEIFVEKVLNIQGLNITFLRSCRLLRITKILRIFRAFRWLRELRLMAKCVVGSLTSLLWATLFLALMLFMAGLVMVQSLTNFRKDQMNSRCDTCDAIETSFGSVTGAMMALFQSTTGGCDWGDMYDILVPSGPTNATFFIAYIIFFTLAFFNIITSMFVDKAMKLAKPDEEALMLERREEELDISLQLRNLIKEVDLDGSGTISVFELEEACSNDLIRHKFEMLGITMRDSRVFFATLSSIVRSPKLSIDRFVDGCMKMKGPASSLDVQAISFQVRELAQHVRLLGLYVQEQGAGK